VFGSCRLALLTCLLCSPAAAQPAALPLELSWQAPSECPTASDVHAELARIASAAPDETPRSLAADVTISSHGARYTARLTTKQGDLVGERTLQAEDCATLTRSVTLVLALAFGRGVQLRQDTTPTEPSTAAAPVPAASAEPMPSPPTATPPPEREPQSDEAGDDADAKPSRIRFGALLGGGAQLTLMPSVAPILTAGAALDLDALSIELRASALPGTTEPLDTGTDARAVLDGLLATALACTHVSLANFCAGGRGGAIRARSRGLFETGREIAPWYALALSAGLSWPEQSPVQLSLEALLAISITRPRFEITGYGIAHRAPLLAPELSAFLRFWP
jgi:hypothetical protein